MTLTATQRTLVQSSFTMVKDADALATCFYNRLFEIDPSTRPLFKGDMAEQRQKLMQTLAVVVNALDSLDTVIPAIEALGKRHMDYGVTIAHWDSVGEALLWSLAETFGEQFTEDIGTAWATAYRLIAETAISASYPIKDQR